MDPSEGIGREGNRERESLLESIDVLKDTTAHATPDSKEERETVAADEVKRTREDSSAEESTQNNGTERGASEVNQEEVVFSASNTLPWKLEEVKRMKEDTKPTEIPANYDDTFIEVIEAIKALKDAETPDWIRMEQAVHWLSIHDKVRINIQRKTLMERALDRN